MFITNGTWADVALLFARTGGARATRASPPSWCPTDTPGLTRRAIHGKLGLRGQATAELSFDDVRVPADAPCSAPRARASGRHVGARQGPDVGRRRLRRHRPGLPGRGGRLRHASAQQFGKPDRVAPAGPGTDRRHLRRRRRGPAAGLAGRRPRSTAASRSPPRPPRPSSSPPRPPCRAANNALQVFGGYGYIDEYPVGKLLRDARVMTLYEGTSQIQKLLIGRAETGVNAFL